MKLAILSSGPSLLESWETRNADDYDAIVGIGCACSLVEVDWMCWMDALHVREMIERGREPRIGSVWHFDDFRWCRNPSVQYEAYPFKSDGRRHVFTIAAAIDWTLSKWPKSNLDLVGCDWTDGPNCLGYSSHRSDTQHVIELAEVESVLRRRGRPSL